MNIISNTTLNMADNNQSNNIPNDNIPRNTNNVNDIPRIIRYLSGNILALSGALLLFLFFEQEQEQSRKGSS